MPHNPSPAWYARYQQGESFTQIAQSAHVTRSRVAGAIRRYREEMNLPPRTKAAPEAQSKPVPASRRPLNRQSVDPEALAQFDQASQDRTCLWIDGDLRDGKVAVCGMRRDKGAYCADHHARGFVQKASAP